MEKNLEDIIIRNLIQNEPFCRKALPHLKIEYFDEKYAAVYDLILSFISKYNKLPNAAVLEIEFQNSIFTNRQDSGEILSVVRQIDIPEQVDDSWLLDTTEMWCKDRAVHLAILESIQIINGKVPDKAQGAIPDILSKALSVTFNTDVGHDYLNDAQKRYELYQKVENKIPCDIEMLNTITNGGVSKKTLNIILASCVHPDTLIKVRLRKKNQTSYVYDSEQR